MKKSATTLLQSLILCLLAWVVFGQSLKFGFFNYDDYDYLFHTPFLREPWSLSVLGQIFSYMGTGNWHPLVWISLKIDGDIFHQAASGYHLTNTILHLLNAIMIFGLLKRWMGSYWKAFFVAALFLVHPHRAESVVWIVERKDVLSGFFFILTLWSYTKYVACETKKSILWYLFTLLLLILGLLTKSMLMTVPFLLLLLDYWPLRRIHKSTEISKCSLEKIPFFVVAMFTGFMAIYSRSEVSLDINEQVHFLTRVLNAFVFYALYIRDSLLPFDLIFYRAYPFDGFTIIQYIGSIVLIMTVSLLLFLMRKKVSAAFVGWFWFLGSLVPVIGFIHVGYSAYPDRYMYLPCIGLWIMFVTLISKLFSHGESGSDSRGKLLMPVAVIMVLAMTMLGWRQVSLWRTSETLYRHSLKHQPENYQIHEALCDYLADEDRLEEAIKVCKQAVEKFPERVNASRAMGRVYFKRQQYQLAKQSFERMLQVAMKHRYRHEIDRDAQVERELSTFNHIFDGLIDRKHAEQAFYVLGNFWRELRFYRLSVDAYKRALELSPGNIPIHVNLANVYFLNGKIDVAKKHFEFVLEQSPDDISANFNYGILLDSTGSHELAKAKYQKVLSIQPDHEGASKLLDKMGGN